MSQAKPIPIYGNLQGKSPLDRPVAVKRFPDRFARSKRQIRVSLRKLTDQISAKLAASKDELPFLKLAEFGDHRTPKDCLRSNAKVRVATGVEGDDDAGIATSEEARDRPAKAGVAALMQTTASHPPDAPQGSVMCPFSGPLKPDARARHLAGLNGVLNGELAREPSTLSQSCYAGVWKVLRRPDVPCQRGSSRHYAYPSRPLKWSLARNGVLQSLSKWCRGRRVCRRCGPGLAFACWLMLPATGAAGQDCRPPS